MRYFTDSAGHVARVHTDAAFGDEFSYAKAEVYNVKRQDWIYTPTITTDIQFSGDWMSCSEADAESIIKRRGRVLIS